MKSCENCTNRFLCPNNYRVCDGYNDENLFWSLILLHFPILENRVVSTRKFIKSLQEENIGREREQNEKI